MAVKLIANYAKKIGLPGYSSHQFSVSVETELRDVSEIENESALLYATLQHAVDQQIKETGFVPPHGYGMPEGTNGSAMHGGSHGGQNGDRQPGSAPKPLNGNGRGFDRWRCTDGQRGLILRLTNEHCLDKSEIEALAQQLFGAGVKQLDKMQASQLIEELLEKTGQKRNGSRSGSPRRQEVSS